MKRASGPQTIGKNITNYLLDSRYLKLTKTFILNSDQLNVAGEPQKRFQLIFSKSANNTERIRFSIPSPKRPVNVAPTTAELLPQYLHSVLSTTYNTNSRVFHRETRDSHYPRLYLSPSFISRHRKTIRDLFLRGAKESNSFFSQSTMKVSPRWRRAIRLPVQLHREQWCTVCLPRGEFFGQPRLVEDARLSRTKRIWLNEKRPIAKPAASARHK